MLSPIIDNNVRIFINLREVLNLHPRKEWEDVTVTIVAAWEVFWWGQTGWGSKSTMRGVKNDQDRGRLPGNDSAWKKQSWLILPGEDGFSDPECVYPGEDSTEVTRRDVEGPNIEGYPRCVAEWENKWWDRHLSCVCIHKIFQVN